MRWLALLLVVSLELLLLRNWDLFNNFLFSCALWGVAIFIGVVFSRMKITERKRRLYKNFLWAFFCGTLATAALCLLFIVYVTAFAFIVGGDL